MAFSNPRLATWMRSSSGSPRPRNRRARYSTRGRWSSTSRSRADGSVGSCSKSSRVRSRLRSRCSVSVTDMAPVESKWRSTFRDALPRWSGQDQTDRGTPLLEDERHLVDEACQDPPGECPVGRRRPRGHGRIDHDDDVDIVLRPQPDGEPAPLRRPRPARGARRARAGTGWRPSPARSLRSGARARDCARDCPPGSADADGVGRLPACPRPA